MVATKGGNIESLLFPNYDNIMGILIELIAILGKPYKSKDFVREDFS